jgi:hypothetical protein
VLSRHRRLDVPDLAVVVGLTRQCAGLLKLGTEQVKPHIDAMPPKGSSPRPLDLFEYTLTIPTPQRVSTSVPAGLPELASLSDAQLAQQFGQLLVEVQSRLKKGRGGRPELEAAARQASLLLKSLVPDPVRQHRPSRSRKVPSPLQEGQRKAVRAALLAGVAPAQVARHFGLSLSAIRKVLAEIA